MITGAASGLGRGIALRLSGSQRLILADINTEQLEFTRSRCETPERHLLWTRDLSHLEGLGEELASFLKQQELSVEHFIHSAGVFAVQRIRNSDMASVKRLFSVNVFAAMELIRPLVQKRVNKGALRSITLISSTATRIVAAEGYSVYAASKGALNAMALSLAVELAPAVRVNTILPGIIGTEMNSAHFANPDFVAAIEASHPLGLGRPDDIAEMAAFLCSDRSRWITGQELVVDGGRCANK